MAQLHLGGPPDIRISIFDWSFQSLKVLDASRNAKLSQMRLLPEGCDSATITLSCRSEDFERLYPWWLGRNGVEISTADDLTQAAINTNTASFTVAEVLNGAVARVYVGNKNAYRTSNGEDQPQIAIWDGATLCMRMAVVGNGTDGTGDYVAVAAPIAGGGNPTTIPAYGAGAVIYRRRYAGRIARREKSPGSGAMTQTISCVGVSSSLQGVSGNWTISAANDGTRMDVATAMFNVLNSAASTRFPDLVIQQANFPALGYGYAGQRQGTMASMVQDILGAVPGDVVVLRIGADRVARAVRPFVSSTNTYPYNVVFDNRALYWAPRDLRVIDQDMSAYASGQEVTGDTDPQTQNPVAAIVLDSVAIANWGQVDAGAASNTAMKTQADALASATALIKRTAAPTTSVSFAFHTRNLPNAKAAQYSPIGIAQGNPLDGLQAVTIKGVNATGSVRNRVADSELLWTAAIFGMWSTSGGMALGVGTGTGGSNAWSIAAQGGSGNAYAYGQSIDVAPGEYVTIAGDVAASGITGGTMRWAVYTPDLLTLLGAATQSAGASGRVAYSFRISTSYAFDTVLVVPQAVATTGSGTVRFSHPQFEGGTTASAYAPNDASPNLYGLPSYVEETLVAGAGRTVTVQFAAVQPDFNAEMARLMNQALAAVRANAAPATYIDRYCVSYNAYTQNSIPFAVAAGPPITCTPPQGFLARFAPTTTIQTMTPGAFTVAPNASTRVWLTAGNSWLTYPGTDYTQPANAILYAIVQTGLNNAGVQTVIGVKKMASIGVVMVGVGNVNVGNHATPAGTSSLVPGSTNNSVHAQIVATVNLTNVPTDDSVSALAFAYRIHGSTDPFTVTDAVPLVRGTSSQTASLGWAIGAGQNIDVFCTYVGVTGNDYGPGWAQIGSPTQISNGFLAQALVVSVPYMIGTGVAAAPTCPVVTLGGTAYPAFTPDNSVNGLSASMTIRWVASNHPQDGSCRRIGIYRRIYKASSPVAYEWYASIPVASAPNPPAGNVIYGIQPADLTNGQQYDWACVFENGQGAESPLGFIGTSPAAAINIGSSAFKSMPAAIRSAGPTITAAALGTPLTGSGVASQPFTVTFGDWTTGNIPDWGAGIFVVLRKTGTHEAIGDPTGYAFTSNPAGVGFTVQIPAAVGVDVGFYYHDTANSDSNVWWPPSSGAGSVLGNVVGGAINPGQSVAGTGKINYVADSPFAYKLAHWKSAGTPVMTTYPKNNANTGNPEPFAGSPGTNVNCTGALYNQPFTPSPGAQYTESCFVGWLHTGGGAATMYVAICDVSDWNANGGLGNVTPATLYTSPRAIPVGGGTDVTDVHWTCPSSGGPTQVCFVWYWSNANYPFSMSKPMIEPGAQWTGYVPGVATTDTGAGGTQARAVAHSDYQLTAIPGGGVNIASPLHTNKNLDNVPAGSTYGAVNNSYRQTDGSGRIAPIIDFAMTGNTNKNLDNVADGTTSGKTNLFYRYADGSGRQAPLVDVGSASHLNKTLDAINDGSTYGRLYVSTIYTDGTGRRIAAIDLASASHLNKNVDSLNDGSTYVRVLGSRVSVGRPFVDFSESFNLNRTLDYIADSASYGRLALSYLYTDGAGHRAPIVDFAGAAHVNKTLDYIASTTGGQLRAKNLVVNGNNANGTGSPSPDVYGWTNAYLSGTIASSGTYVVSGRTWTMMIVASAQNTGRSQQIRVVPGATYTFMAIAIGAGGVGAIPQVWVGDTAFAVAQYNSGPATPIGSLTGIYAGLPQVVGSDGTSYGTYQLLCGTFTIPSSNANGLAAVLLRNIGTGGAAYFLAAQVYQGNRLQDFIDHEPTIGAAHVDLGQAAHLNKNLDNVLAGATWGAINNAYRYIDGSSRTAPLIDFLGASHLNKSLDAVPDGSTYGRVALSTIYTDGGGARRAIVDLGYSGHLNTLLITKLPAPHADTVRVVSDAILTLSIGTVGGNSILTWTLTGAAGGTSNATNTRPDNSTYTLPYVTNSFNATGAGYANGSPLFLLLYYNGSAWVSSVQTSYGAFTQAQLKAANATGATPVLVSANGTTTGMTVGATKTSTLYPEGGGL